MLLALALSTALAFSPAIPLERTPIRPRGARLQMSLSNIGVGSCGNASPSLGLPPPSGRRCGDVLMHGGGGDGVGGGGGDDDDSMWSDDGEEGWDGTNPQLFFLMISIAYIFGKRFGKPVPESSRGKSMLQRLREEKA